MSVTYPKYDVKSKQEVFDTAAHFGSFKMLAFLTANVTHPVNVEAN